MTVKSEDIKVRALGPEHNQQMLEVLHRCPMETARLSLLFDRLPRMAASTELHYDRFKYGGFFVGDRLLGLALVAFDEVYVNGQPERVYAITDYYLCPEIRGHKLIVREQDFFFGDTGPDQLGYAVILKGNRPMETVAAADHQDRRCVPYTRFAAEQDIQTLFVTTRKRESGRYQVRAATRSDVEALAAFLDADFRTRLFGPVVTREKLLRDLGRRPNFGLDSYLLVERKGELLGACATWDTTPFKQNRVVRYGTGLKILRFAFGLAGKALGFRPMPAEGEAFRDMFVFDCAARDRDPEILRAALLVIYNQCRRAGYNSLAFGTSQDDPLLGATQGFHPQSVLSRILLLCRNRARLEGTAVDTRLAYQNIALL
jgi:hypothetical protein